MASPHRAQPKGQQPEVGHLRIVGRVEDVLGRGHDRQPAGDGGPVVGLELLLVAVDIRRASPAGVEAEGTVLLADAVCHSRPRKATAAPRGGISC